MPDERTAAQMHPLIRAWRINHSQVNGMLWRSRHAIRQGNARLALEALYGALWLLGATE